MGLLDIKWGIFYINKQEKLKAKLSKNKKLLILLVSIIIICIIVLFFYLNISQDEKVAQLIVESGIVEIKHSNGPWTIAQNGTDLYRSDSIRTGEDSSASVILFKSSIIRLYNNTEIKIDEFVQENGETNIKIRQDSGRTWNTILKISGIEYYEVKTPTTSAAVRGTSFFVEIKSNKTVYIGVTSGFINVTSYLDDEIIDRIMVSENKSVIIYFEDLHKLLKIDLLVLNDWIVQNIEKDEKQKDEVEDDLYKRIEEYIPQIKEIYGITDEELEALIQGYIDGYYDLLPETPDWIREIIELS